MNQRRAAKRSPQTRSDRNASEESWDHVASWYDSEVAESGTDHHRNVIVPGVLRLLELEPKAKVLDMACGQGVLSRGLSKAGAEVTGVDLSPRLIKLARQRSSSGADDQAADDREKTVQYRVGDIRRLDFLAESSFDAIVFVLGAQNVDPIEPVFGECARLLRSGGRLVMVLNHPAFRIPRQSSWHWDEDRGQVYRAVDRYLSPLKIPIDMQPFKSPGKRVTWTYHRPIQTYVNGLSAVGLLTDGFEEWISQRSNQPGSTSKAENRARAEFPLFLAMRAVKVVVV